MTPRRFPGFVLLCFVNAVAGAGCAHSVQTLPAEPRSAFTRYFEDSVAAIELMRDATTGLVSDKVVVRRVDTGFRLDPLQAEGRASHNAHTSPTNIGLDLLVQAERVAKKSNVEAAEKNLNRVLDTMAALPRHPTSNLFFSWYAAKDGAVTDHNVSSVDNLHLALGLWTLSKAASTKAIRSKAAALFASINFAVFLDPETGFVGGNLRWDGRRWELEPWFYQYFGSEARSLYTIGWALGLFRDVDSQTLAKAIAALQLETSSWKDGADERELLHTWDGGLFQHFLPELLVSESRYSIQLGKQLGNVARFAFDEGRRLELSLAGVAGSLPVAASASNGAVDFSENKFGGVPAYLAFAGIERLTATENHGNFDREHRGRKQQLLAPYAVFLLSLFEPERSLAVLTALEKYDGPPIESTTGKEALYIPGVGFLDGVWVAGPERGKVVPVVLHLDQAMSALAAAAHARPGTMMLTADTLRRDPIVSVQLRAAYRAVSERLRVGDPRWSKRKLTAPAPVPPPLSATQRPPALSW